MLSELEEAAQRNGTSTTIGKAAPVAPKVSAQSVGIRFQARRADRPVQAVRDLSMDIPAGEFVSIVGPSGCGKSTMLKAIAGLVPITSGTLRIDGKDVRGPGPDRAMVFQAPSLLPWRTVLANVSYALELRGVSKVRREARARDLIALVGLQGFEEKFPHQLSGGMQQRVSLARGLSVDPEILMLDEPLAALDALTREFMQRELLDVYRKTGNTMLFVTHGISEAVYLASRVIVMSARPGCVRDVIEIDLPDDRPLSIKRSPEFHAYEERIWTLIEQEVRRTGLLGS